MRDFWAVVGKLLVDKNFYQDKIFPLCGYKKKFEDLGTLRLYFLRDLELGLSRWEIMRINEIATEQFNGDHLIEVKLASQEASIAAVQTGWVGSPPDLKSQFALCGVIGLASMDINFREGLHRASKDNPEDTAALKEFLENSQGDTPVFKLPDSDIKTLNKLLRSLVDSWVDALKVFHYTNWVQPDKHPCDGGVTKTVILVEVAGVISSVIVPYKHFSQNGLNLHLKNQPQSVIKDLEDSRAIL